MSSYPTSSIVLGGRKVRSTTVPVEMSTNSVANGNFGRAVTGQQNTVYTRSNITGGLISHTECSAPSNPTSNIAIVSTSSSSGVPSVVLPLIQ